MEPSDGPALVPPLIGLGAVMNGAGPGTVDLGMPSGAGTLLVITIATNVPTNFTLPPEWTLSTPTGSNGSCYAMIAYYLNNPGGITTVNYGQTGAVPTVLQISEFTGITALDTRGTIAGANPTTSQTVQATAAGPNELAVTVFCEDVNMPTYTGETGWTNLGKVTNTSSSPSFASDFRVLPTAGLVSETQTSTVSGKYAAYMGLFR